MKIYQKVVSGHTTRKCHLTLMLPNKLQKLYLFSKKNVDDYRVVYFNNLPINRKCIEKHIGLLLDEELNFSEHIIEKLKR